MAEPDFEVHPSGTYSMISEDSLKMLSLANLLRVSKCPNTTCVDGILYPDMTECQFCAERERVLKEVDDD